MKEFETFHPTVILLYFLAVIFFTMFLTHPVFLIISLIMSVILIIKVDGVKQFKKKLLFALILFFTISILNPIFVHQGATPLFYVNDSPITLEATIYGLVFACMLVSTIFWFNSFNRLMTSDKLIYLFSKNIPTIGLILSMILRFIPRFQRQLNKIMDINKVVSDKYTSKDLLQRLKTVLITFSTLVTWTFENSIDTADSMKARGYGLRNRTNFHLFKFQLRDAIVIVIILFLTIINIFFYYKLNLHFYYYPDIAKVNFDFLNCLSYLNYLLLLSIPLIIEIREELRWKLLISKI